MLSFFRYISGSRDPKNGIKVGEPFEVNHSIAYIRTKQIKPLEIKKICVQQRAGK